MSDVMTELFAACVPTAALRDILSPTIWVGSEDICGSLVPDRLTALQSGAS